MPITLILGGARSGKSRHAEYRAQSLHQSGSTMLHYVATAVPFDEEMKTRIRHHQEQRINGGWMDHECSVMLPKKLEVFNDSDIVLVDCLTVWLNNIIYNEGHPISDSEVKSQVDQLVTSLSATQADVTLVSNEVGLGVIPLGKETRLFVDHAGWMNQRIAAVADNVILVTAGLPIALKGTT